MSKGFEGAILNRRKKLLTNLQCINARTSSMLIEIDFSENFLIEVGELGQHRFQHLTCLNLSMNMIISIEPFKHCSFNVLEKLYLFGNEIKDMSPLVSCGLKGLLELRILNGFPIIEGNQVTTVQHIATLPSDGLQELCLDCNQISTIKPLSASFFSNLNLLYLSNNQITHIDQSVFIAIPALKVFSAKQNYLTNLRFLSKCNAFTKTWYLNFSDNCINNVAGIHQSHCNQLTKINIGQNQLTNFRELFKCQWAEASQLSYGSSIQIFARGEADQVLAKFLKFQTIFYHRQPNYQQQ